MSQSLKKSIGSPVRRWQGSFIGTLVLTALLTVPQLAAACPWYDPFCFKDIARGAFELAWDIATLDPKEFFEDFMEVKNHFVCNEFSSPLPLVSLVVSMGIREDFDDCNGPSGPIDSGVLAQLKHYFKHPLDSVRIHQDCNLDGDVFPGGRSAITFGEHIYFAPEQYHPQDAEGFANLAHELIHVLQYRHLGFAKFSCAYGIDCIFGAYRGCSFEREAEAYEAAVLKDFQEDKDGIFGEEDNCPHDFNPKQEDTDRDGVGNTCDLWPYDRRNGLFPTPGTPEECALENRPTCVGGQSWDDWSCKCTCNTSDADWCTSNYWSWNDNTCTCTP